MADIRVISGGGYTASINIERGANCISLRHPATDSVILREPEDADVLDNPYLYGMPVLFPVNRISGGEFEFEGRVYSFPINEPDTNCHLHGELHCTPFEVLSHSADEIVCRYRADSASPYLSFPHEFEMLIGYRLGDEGLLHTVSITNLSDKNMPCMLGFHTTFYNGFCRSDNDCEIYADVEKEYARNMKNYLPNGETPPFDEISRAISQGCWDPTGAPTSRHYRAGQTGRSVIYNKAKDISLVYEADKKLGFRLIYNGNADEYVCLEPQSCLANAPNSPFDRAKAGFDYLSPMETRVYTSRIYVSAGDKRQEH